MSGSNSLPNSSHKIWSLSGKNARDREIGAGIFKQRDLVLWGNTDLIPQTWVKGFQIYTDTLKQIGMVLALII